MVEKKQYKVICSYYGQGYSKHSCKRMVKAESKKTISDRVNNRENIIPR